MLLSKESQRLARTFEMACQLVLKGSFDKAKLRLQRILAQTIESSDWEFSARSLNEIGWIHYQLGEYEDATSAYQWAVHFGRRSNSLSILAMSQNCLGLVYVENGFLDQARKALEEALALRQESNDKKGIASSLNNMGLLEWRYGNFFTAIEYYRNARVLFEEIKNQEGILSSLNNEGLIKSTQGDYEASRALFLEARRIASSINNYARSCSLTINLGNDEVFKGNPRKATQYFKEGLILAESAGIEGSTRVLLLFGLCEASLLEGKINQAKKFLNVSKKFVENQYSFGKGEFLLLQGRIEQQRGNLKSAKVSLLEAMTVSTTSKDLSTEIRSAVRLVALYLKEYGRTGEKEILKTAKQCLDRADSIAQKRELYSLVTEVITLRALFYSAQLELSKAENEIDKAISLAAQRNLQIQLEKAKKVESMIILDKKALKTYDSFELVKQHEIRLYELSLEQFSEYIRDIESYVKKIF